MVLAFDVFFFAGQVLLPAANLRRELLPLHGKKRTDD
jgi:hypothetical protein